MCGIFFFSITLGLSFELEYEFGGLHKPVNTVSCYYESPDVGRLLLANCSTQRQLLVVFQVKDREGPFEIANIAYFMKFCITLVAV